MPFQLQHSLFAKFIEPTLRESPGEAFFEINEESQFQILFPGKLARRASASFVHRFRVERPLLKPAPVSQEVARSLCMPGSTRRKRRFRSPCGSSHPMVSSSRPTSRRSPICASFATIAVFR